MDGRSLRQRVFVPPKNRRLRLYGPVFLDAQEQITELLHHFENRIDFVLKKITKEMTGYEISQTLFTDRNSVLEQWIGIGATNAFLQYMVSKGEVRVDKVGKQYKYKRV
ncbi:hypothetical protein PH210_13365 [Paenibacillus sp. BSR1-1]|uniref:hypothetical protein n=1 Tax=Paenibacillus sp. BSR1-1 TaxID=3020845 RepID=UPI0025AF192B|nr:hypothetical protein [Paenibacillus sp. BSR1-1]MDN3017181.1 hypothetical protein [Paenibacillus sp. BSR1-1]